MFVDCIVIVFFDIIMFHKYHSQHIDLAFMQYKIAWDFHNYTEYKI